MAKKDADLVQIDHVAGEKGQHLVERMYPLVAEGISNGLFIPNRRPTTRCSYCPYTRECEAEYGSVIH